MVQEHTALIATLERPAPQAVRLLELVAGLGAPFGLERSIKIMPGAVLEGRFLLSLHKSALGADPLAGLSRIAALLNMPAGCRDGVAANIAAADIVHFGFEPGRSVTCKLYLEFAGQFRNPPGPAVDDGASVNQAALVHLAFKWDPAASGPGTVAYYRCRPGLTKAKIRERLSAICGKNRDGRVLGMASDLLDMATERMDGQDIFFMEVTEENNPRRSFDINVYDADLTLDAIAPLLADAWRHFAIPAERANALTASLGSQPLGHVSGGTGRDGSEFLTVYFGVESH